jgi:UDP-glucose 4-epimerase
MKKYLVTGGAGFIGSNIVEELVFRGESVRVLDNFSTGRRQNIEHLLNDIELIEGDIRDFHTVFKAVQGIDYVLHQAALPSVPRSVIDPISSNEVNIKGTLNLLYASRDARVKRFVFASSSSVYGENQQSPKMEDFAPYPKTPYAVTKITGEYYCRNFFELYGLETVCLRYFNAFGPRQNPYSQYSAVIPLFLKALQSGKSPIVYGDGLQSRDFTFVKNNVNANFLACEAPQAAGQIYNIASNTSYTLLDVIAQINRLLGTKIDPVFEAERPGDIKHSLASISKAQDQLGYRVDIGFESGLEKLIANPGF